MAQQTVSNPAIRHKSGLSYVYYALQGRPKADTWSFGCQLSVAIEEDIQQDFRALVQQGDDPLTHGGWQAEAMLSLTALLQDCRQMSQPSPRIASRTHKAGCLSSGLCRGQTA